MCKCTKWPSGTVSSLSHIIAFGRFVDLRERQTNHKPVRYKLQLMTIEKLISNSVKSVKIQFLNKTQEYNILKLQFGSADNKAIHKMLLNGQFGD